MPIKEEEAMFMEAFPVNSLPFLNRIVEILVENKTNSIQSLKGKELDKAKACLFVLNAHAYGQLFSIESLKEYERLKQSLKPTGSLASKHLG